MCSTESAMQDRNNEYCQFRDITALVLTWNAGASKPNYLSNKEQDAAFFGNLLRDHDPPDIITFGFQELVDLEDKKVTACKSRNLSRPRCH